MLESLIVLFLYILVFQETPNGEHYENLKYSHINYNFLKFGTEMELQLTGKLKDIGRTSSVRNIFIALVFVDPTRLVEHCVDCGHLNLRDDEKRL